GQAPVALPADVPVAHVLEPVLHAAPRRRRQPGHLRRGGHELRAQLVHRDEPLVVDAEDDLLVAAPALGITVGVVRRPEEPATLALSHFCWSKVSLGTIRISAPTLART